MTIMAAKYKTVINIFRFLLELTIYAVYRFCRFGVGVCEFIINIKNCHSVVNSAQQGRILWRQKHFVMDETSPLDFLCMFNSRVKPEYVLRPNVSLYAITNKEAIFVETSEKVNIYSSNVHPFFFVAQFLCARKVIKLSISDFVCLAERVGDPTVPVIWMSNTGRCGGTMLCQVFECVPGILVMHEPDPPLPLYYLRENGNLRDSQYDAILKAIIRVLCKPHPGIKRFCIKPRPQCTIMMKDITRLLPNIRQMFIYRNSLDTIISWIGAIHCEPYPAVCCACANAEWFSNMCPYFRNIHRHYFVLNLKDFHEIPEDTNTACMLAYMWSYYILIAREAMSCDPNILSVKYEDILSRPRETLRQIFQGLQIETIHVDRAVSSLDRDSQGGSVMSRDRLASNKHMSRVDRTKVDAILSKFNLPPLGQDIRI